MYVSVKALSHKIRHGTARCVTRVIENSSVKAATTGLYRAVRRRAVVPCGAATHRVGSRVNEP